LCLALAASAAAAQQAADPAPREMLQRLNAVRVDEAQIFRARDLYLRRDVVRLSLEEGKIAFLTSLDGHVLGAVFSGQGRVLAIPHDPAEKRSLGRFLGAPLLDQTFSRAYLRFTDNAAEELRAQLQQAGARPIAEPSLVEEWNPTVANLNPWHSLRTLADLLAARPQPYFYAGLESETLGAFEILVDSRREEQLLIGQMRFVSGVRYFDTWASFARSDMTPPTAPFRPAGYALVTTIFPDLALEGRATLELKAVGGRERIVPLELSRRLAVGSVTDDSGRSLAFFQNEEMTRDEIAQRGNDSVFIVLPQAPPAGAEFHLQITYRGNVISDAGNGVYFVGERGSWFPHVAGSSFFVPFDLSFRWPRKLQLVATGKKVKEREAEEWREGHWKSEQPIPVAGFNLGDYVSGRIETDTWKIELYANRQLEREVANRVSRPTVIEAPVGRTPAGRTITSRVIWPDPPPSPAAILGPLGENLADAIRFYETLMGPFPFERLAVAQIPGSFGQGWPGLLYLSTLSFLSPSQQQRAGIGKRTQDQFNELVPFHEAAHQWWGNVVGWASYRDQWLNEGLANYLALMFAESKQPGELQSWLETYRAELSATNSGSNETVDEVGPLALGYRLRSSHSPRGFSQLIYPKGTWVFHMLRSMLRDSGLPQARKTGAPKDPDARFTQLLQALAANYRHHALTTADLQREVEKVMTPEMDLEGSRKTAGRPGAMDWFFDEWVRGTGIPKYSVEFDVKPREEQFVVRGKLKQSGVADSFLAPVPIYAPRTVGKPLLLGTVVTNGPETPFQFTVRSAPKKLLIDPYFTLLSLTE
jgi:hypothetical protein